jgi:hypothetical protein
MGDRLRLLGEVDSFVGKYFSKQYVRSHVLRMTEDEIADEDKQMDVEERQEPEDDMSGDEQQDQEQDQEQQESFVAANTISEEEKSLVDNMTQFANEELKDK